MPIQVGVWDPVGSSYQFHCVSLYQPVRWFHPILHLARRYVVNVLCYTEILMLILADKIEPVLSASNSDDLELIDCESNGCEGMYYI